MSGDSLGHVEKLSVKLSPGLVSKKLFSAQDPGVRGVRGQKSP